MSTQEILEYCLSKPGAYLNQPFGPEPLCVRIGKRIFAELYVTRGWLTFSGDPAYGLMLRKTYPDSVQRGYHSPPLQQPYHNTVTLDSTVPDEALIDMIDHSYAYSLHKLTRAERAVALPRQTTEPDV
ncbi:MAG TPA: MmcQ/YjbR family DNA-binding protein [Candidatus Limiplasma sp.]|mgnify:CR=1 FL=1|jgi:predicted DNA-binding protein (MmcQ/YjbR family)|nr:MmcQ/YjbR family DNA-binding protein [Candidatus Limiplasma sp.]HPR77604.1 MmcQ/YjbR family DNA-binding protein [Candidatus Limiplasma sp.]